MSKSIFASLRETKNLQTAWEHVRANMGAAGIDRVTIQDFESRSEQELALIAQELANNSYQHAAYLSFKKPKSSAGTRQLFIPTVRDRVVQQAILQIIQPVCDQQFRDCSYAYRPGSSAIKAIARIERHLHKGLTHFLNADIRNFFDAIDRELLRTCLGTFVDDKETVSLIFRCIEALPNEANKGIAQGMVLAPILSNIYLHSFDDAMMRGSWQYLRYSDNFMVLDKAEAVVQEAWDKSKKLLDGLHLELNQEKTQIGTLAQGFDFLGYHFDENGKQPSQESRQRFEKRLGGVLSKAVELSNEEIHGKIEAIIRGWLNYFSLTDKDRKQLTEELQQKYSQQTPSLPLRILQSALAYQLGDGAGARKMLVSTPPEAAADAEVNYQWGLMCEVSGMLHEAMDAYLAAVRDKPDHGEAFFRLGLLYLQQNQQEKAIRYLQKAVQLRPKEAAVHFALATALDNFNLHGAARQAFASAAGLNSNIKKWLKTGVEKQEPGQLDFSDQDLQLFLRLFSGREGVFARQWLGESGKLGYLPIHKALAIADIRGHLEGKETCAVYMLRADGTVNFMVLDIDISKEVRQEKFFAGSEENWQSFVWIETNKILSRLRLMNMAAYAEDSGHKGAHIWLFFAEPLPAKEVRLFARRLLEQDSRLPPGITIEIFPKSDTHGEKALGSLIKLPLGIHKLTGRRCLFLDAAGKPVADSISFLSQIQLVSKNMFFKELDALRCEKRETSNLPEKGKEVNEMQILLDRCSVLRYLHEKAYGDKMLTHLERLTFLGTVGFLGEDGRAILHEIMSQTLNYDFRITEKWYRRLHGWPLSCPKMRTWHSLITPSLTCNCKFQIKEGSYPTPLLHLDNEFVAKIKQKNAKITPPAEKKADAIPAKETPQQKQHAPAPDVSTAAEAELAALVDQFIKARKGLSRLSKELDQLEKQLNGLSERTGQTRFETQYGVLRRMEIDGKHKWMLEI